MGNGLSARTWLTAWVLVVCAGCAHVPQTTPEIDPVHGVARTAKQACLDGDSNACFYRAKQLRGQCSVTGCESQEVAAEMHEVLKRGCELNHAHACHDLGWTYQNAVGAARNHQRALELFAQACDGGVAKGCANLAYHYGEGLGVAIDQAAALRLRQQACTGGDADSCCALGQHHHFGRGTAVDFQEAEQWYRQACMQRSACGCLQLGYVLEKGLSADKDPAFGFLFYNLACELGEMLGCSNAGWMLQHGDGVEPDPDQAKTLYERACEGNEARACTRLAELAGDDTPQGRATMQALLQKACLMDDARACQKLQTTELALLDPDVLRQRYAAPCRRGEAQACWVLGDRLLRGRGVRKDEREAAQWMRIGCEHGSARACHEVAWQLSQGVGVALDLGAARAAAFKSCEGGYPPGCTLLGYFWAEGLGGSVDGPRAAILYERACQAGESTACLNLGVLYRDGQARIFHQGRGSCADAGASDVEREGRSPMPSGIGEHLSATAPHMRRANPRSPNDPIGFSDLCHEIQSSERRQAHQRGRPGEISGQGVPPNAQLAVRYAQAGCDLKDPLACGNLGIQLLKGEGIEKDLDRAAPLLEQGCGAQDGEACYFLGLALEGSEPNASNAPNAAALQFEKACELKEQRACARIRTKAPPAKSPKPVRSTR